MSDHVTENIRNIALVGHTGAGKTTLCETLLAAAGAVSAPGSVEKGTTVSDSDPREKTFQHSINAAVLHLGWGEAHVNLVDTPGYPDFLGQILPLLTAVETVAVVINAENGIESMTRYLMDWAGARGLCRMIIVNRMDAERCDLESLLEQIRAGFGPECLALNLPARGASTVADCFFSPAGESDFASVAAMHEMLVDQVVEVDEELMSLYLDQGGELDPAQLHGPFEEALRAGHLIPVCFTSARTGAGVRELLDVFARLMPNPTEGNPAPFLRETADDVEEFHARPDPDAHVIAHVVKVEHDPFTGKLGVFRVHQGTIARDSRLFIGDGRKAFKVGGLYQTQGHDLKDIVRAVPGDICAVRKVEEIHFNAVLHDSHDDDHIRLRAVDLPAPVFGLALKARRHGDEQKISEVLVKLTDEDPGLRVEHNPVTNETVLRGLGELHLNMSLEKLEQRFNVQVDTSTPSIAYRETVLSGAEGHYRHKKQTGGAGQFGEVYLRIEALPRGAGFEFVDEIRGGTIPQNLVPAVEKGVRQAMDHGAVAGFPMQDIRVVVYDGKTHPVDSKDIAFQIAGRKAFLDAVSKARPIVLEPFVNVDIDVPSAAMGDISGDLASRRGRIQDTVGASERIVIRACVPLAELDDYPMRLKAMTGGEGRYSLQFSHYEQAPGQVQERLAAAFRPVEEEN